MAPQADIHGHGHGVNPIQVTKVKMSLDPPPWWPKDLLNDLGSKNWKTCQIRRVPDPLETIGEREDIFDGAFLFHPTKILNAMRFRPNDDPNWIGKMSIWGWILIRRFWR